jgi:hypothetical protein
MSGYRDRNPLMKNFGAVYTEGKILPRVSPFFASSLTIFSDIFITMVSFLTHKWGSSPVRRKK